MTHRRALMGGRETRAHLAVGLAVRGAAGGEGGTLRTAGYASTTGQPYDMYDWWGDSYAEVVDVGAFERVLAASPDVRALVNHQGIPLARTLSGTLTLAEHTAGATTGLYHEADLDPASPLALEVTSAIRRGDLTEMSFAFTARAEWSPDYTQRNIREITGLYDVAYVTYPANPGTSVGLHSAGLVGAEARAARQALAGLRAGRPLAGAAATVARRLLARELDGADLEQLLDDPDEPPPAPSAAAGRPIGVVRRRLAVVA